MHFGALGCVRTLLEIFGFFEFFWQILIIVGGFLTLGVNNHAEISVQGLIISGANYSEITLVAATPPFSVPPRTWLDRREPLLKI